MKNVLIIVFICNFYSCKINSQVTTLDVLNKSSECEQLPSDIRDWIAIDSIRLKVVKDHLINFNSKLDTIFLVHYFDTDANIGSGYGFGSIYSNAKNIFFEFDNVSNVKYLTHSKLEFETINLIKAWNLELLKMKSKNEEKLVGNTQKLYPLFISRILLKNGAIKSINCFSFNKLIP